MEYLLLAKLQEWNTYCWQSYWSGIQGVGRVSGVEYILLAEFLDDGRMMKLHSSMGMNKLYQVVRLVGILYKVALYICPR